MTNAPGDRDGLRPLALQAKDLLGGPCEAVAEVGYDPGEAVQTGLAAGLTPSIARPLTSATQQLGLLSQAAFPSAGATDPSQAPAGQPLTCRFATGAPGRHIRSEAPAACRAGPLTPQCTRHTGGRRRTRWVEEPRWEAMAQRVRRRPEVMKQRQPLAEHPCGTMKRWWEAGSCLMRGLEKVRTECRVTVLAYHLRRVVNLVAMPRLLAALG